MNGIADCDEKNQLVYTRDLGTHKSRCSLTVAQQADKARRLHCHRLVSGLVLLVVLGLSYPLAAVEPLLFLSTQFTPLHETEMMREVILAEFPGEVDFQPYDEDVFTELTLRPTGDAEKPDLIGGVHGDFVALHKEEGLDRLDDVWSHLEDREFVESFIELGKLGEDNNYFVPWMQATYLMAANRRALEYLPEGADLDNLTYDQLRTWASNLYEATGEPKLGFPVGAKGLMHRFLQAYLYPSYTGNMVRKFRSPEAEGMWQEFRELWQFVSPRSVTFTRMDQPLLSDEVWVAWDHTARLVEAFKERPGDFVAFPAPAGPAGRGFMVVLTGLGLPKDAVDRAASFALIEYLTRPEVQLITLQSVGFFPVVETGGAGQLPAELAELNEAVLKQASSEDAVPSLLPVGLGAYSGDFNLVYTGAFSQIILRGKDIRSVLETQAEKLRQVLLDTGAKCWPPDDPSTEACPVE